jgi:hypothetical protein
MPAGAGDRVHAVAHPENPLSDPLFHERRFDEDVLATVTRSGLRDELILMMQGESIKGVPVDLDDAERGQDAALWASLTSAQRADLELIMRGKPTGGRTVELGELEESVDHSVG